MSLVNAFLLAGLQGLGVDVSCSEPTVTCELVRAIDPGPRGEARSSSSQEERREPPPPPDGRPARGPANGIQNGI